MADKIAFFRVEGCDVDEYDGNYSMKYCTVHSMMNNKPEYRHCRQGFEMYWRREGYWLLWNERSPLHYTKFVNHQDTPTPPTSGWQFYETKSPSAMRIAWHDR